ncbi:hypothetical protein [Delftia tsuruhatensis]|uniref:hypothetical protein n=1 Tax=Delftia tsuruhatensis TaxID=180282 RepID=UPI001114633D|nr:hypothetical protein [Delftia tsuruhatensis]MPT54521.1 hypothetical protein [Delftia sp.]
MGLPADSGWHCTSSDILFDDNPAGHGFGTSVFKEFEPLAKHCHRPSPSAVYKRWIVSQSRESHGHKRVKKLAKTSTPISTASCSTPAASISATTCCWPGAWGIYTPNHSVHAAESAAGGCFPWQVRIASRVWIGTGCHLNPGVTIGDVSIIGSGSVVTKDIPPSVIAAGVPCRVGHAITDADKTVFLPRSAPTRHSKEF